jgi:hypothetical protein
MNWLGSVWTWVAEHPVTVVGVVVGLLVVTGFTLAVRAYRVRKREREAALRGRAHKSIVAKWSADTHSEPVRPRDVDLPSIDAMRSRRPDPSTYQGALEIEAGRLAYQIPDQMWLGVQETVEVHLGQMDAKGLMDFAGRGDVRTEDMPIVETMSVSLMSEPGAFDIVPRSEKVQLVKPDLVKGTPFHQADFGKWIWLVTPLQRGAHILLVKVSAAVKDTRGVESTASLPDKIIAVTVRVHFVRATAGAMGRAVPAMAGTVATTLVGIFTHDYWWPYVRDTVWPAVRAMAGMP